MKEYTVDIGGIEHTLQLSDEDAKARGLTSKKDAGAENKARKPANKSQD